MADDPELTERVRRALADQQDVVERRMFGSVGFIVRGTLRLGVGSHPDHVVLLRVAAADLPAALGRAGAKPAVMRGRQMRGWLFLERAAVESDPDLAAWVALGLASVP